MGYRVKHGTAVTECETVEAARAVAREVVEAGAVAAIFDPAGDVIGFMAPSTVEAMPAPAKPARRATKRKAP